jgi:hypothetical protein
MARSRPDRTGWLAPIQALLGIMLAGDVLYLVVFVWPHGTIPIGSVYPADIVGSDAYAHRSHPDLTAGPVTVQLSRFGPDRHYTTVEWLLYLTGHGLAFCLLTIPMIVMASRLVGTVVAGRTFTPATIRRLRVLGFVVLAGGALSEAVEYVASDALMRLAMPKEWLSIAEPDFQPLLWWLLPGLVLLAVSELALRGRGLQDELDTVI